MYKYCEIGLPKQYLYMKVKPKNDNYQGWSISLLGTLRPRHLFLAMQVLLESHTGCVCWIGKTGTKAEPESWFGLHSHLHRA